MRGLAARGHDIHLLAIGCANVGIEPLDRRMANVRALLAFAAAAPVARLLLVGRYAPTRRVGDGCGAA